MNLMSFRTDRNNNPTAFTTDVAKQAGLIKGTDYEQGDSFTIGTATYYTAKLLGDPIALTIKVIDTIGFYTKGGPQRWVYIGIPDWLWFNLSQVIKAKVIHFMYGREGGTELEHLFT